MSSATIEQNAKMQKVVSHAKEYGFVFPSSEIYDGLQAVYDYGPNGIELKSNLRQLWWKAMTQLNDEIVGIESAIFMHPKVWEASGHVEQFNDPMVDNKDSKKRYRADTLLEERAAVYEEEGKAEQAKALLGKMADLMDAENMDGLRDLIVEENIVCPESKTANWTDVRQFNLMFATQTGTDENSTLYMRPETAQGSYVNFLNVQKSARMKVPFGIAQIGKSFRNEVTARQFIFRMREFEQMEMQYFVRPGSEMEWYEKWKAVRMKWHKLIGIKPENLRYHDHDKLAHYANAAADIEYRFPFGWKELEGIHSRTDFDLGRHQAHSGKKLQYVDPFVQEKGKNKYIPYVVETAIGTDRLFLMALCDAYTETEVAAGEGKTKQRTFLKLHPALAPTKAAIFPLVRKDGLPEVARKIYDDLKFDFNLYYEEKAAIGKLYTRQDLAGTPFCIAIDHETLEDEKITVRHRDTTEQDRIPIASLKGYLEERVGMNAVLRELGS